MNFEIGGADIIASGAASKARPRRQRTKFSVRLRIYVALLVLDCIAVSGAFLFGNLLRSGQPFAMAGLNLLAVVLPLYLAIAFNRSVYSSYIFEQWRVRARIALTSFFGAMLAVLFVSFYLKASAEISRAVFLTAGLVAPGLLYGVRKLVTRYAISLFGGQPLHTILIRDNVEATAEAGITVVDAGKLGLRPSIDDPRALDRIGRLIRYADRVVIACEEMQRPLWAAVLKGANIRGEIVTPELARIGSLGAGRFGEQPTQVVSLGPLDMRNRAIKRGLDVALASIGLIAIAPLLALVAIAIRLDSPGPILFVQPRLGRGNRLFPMFKFRSMRSDQCDVLGNVSTSRGDARVTRVGRIIRATSIDELPQLFNVFRGEMSVVGPRPHALGSLAGTKLFWEVDSRYWHRHAAKPGITGLAQVRGFRGATHLQTDLLSRLQADLDYLNGWTIWRDLSILVATLKVILHRNAY